MDGPAELCHHGFNPPERGPWGSRGGGGFCPWLVEPPHPQVHGKQEGLSLPGPGSWEEKGWKKAGAMQAFPPFPHS